MLKAEIVGDDMSEDRNSSTFVLTRSEQRANLKRNNEGMYAPQDYISDPHFDSTNGSYSGGLNDGSR